MAQYMQAKGNKKMICKWRCIYCNQENTGIAVVTAQAKQSYGLIGTTKDKASANVQNAVTEELTRRVNKVNEKHVIPEGVFINGTCSGCLKKQPWSIANKFPLLRLIAGIVLGIFLATLVSRLMSPIDSEGTLTLFVLFMTVVLTAWAVYAGSGKLLQLIAAKQMAGYEAGYFPQLTEPPSQL